MSKFEHFSQLHVQRDPLVLFNIWDAGSAKAVAESGAKAIATGSWSVPAAFGHADGQSLPLDIAIDNIRHIVERVHVPVTLDFEGGYAVDPDEAIAQNQTNLTDAFFNDPSGTDLSKIFATRLELTCQG